MTNSIHDRSICSRMPKWTNKWHNLGMNGMVAYHRGRMPSPRHRHHRHQSSWRHSRPRRTRAPRTRRDFQSRILPNHHRRERRRLAADCRPRHPVKCKHDKQMWIQFGLINIFDTVNFRPMNDRWMRLKTYIIALIFLFVLGRQKHALFKCQIFLCQEQHKTK